MKKILIVFLTILIAVIFLSIFNKNKEANIDYEMVKKQVEPTVTHLTNSIKKHNYKEA